MKSTVKEITYARRINLGNYEHSETSATAIPAEGQDPKECLAELKALVEGTETVESPKQLELPEVKEETPAPKPKKTKKVEEVKEEEVASEEVQEETKKETKKKVVKKQVFTPYDRSNQLHKTFFGEILDSKYPDWKVNKDVKAKAVQVSMDLNGQDMLDAEGIVIEEFKAKVEKAMA